MKKGQGMLAVLLILLSALCFSAAFGAEAETAWECMLANLSVSGQTVTADYHASQDAVAAARIMNESDNSQREIQKTNVSAGDGSFSLSFSNIPSEGYYVEAWLEDASGNKISDVAEDCSGTTWAKSLENIQAADYAADRIVTLVSTDENTHGEGSFLVVKDDVLLLRSGEHSIEILSETDGTPPTCELRFTPSGTQDGLSSGKKVFLDIPGNYRMGLIQSVEQDGNSYILSLSCTSFSSAGSLSDNVRANYIEALSDKKEFSVSQPFDVSKDGAHLKGTAIITGSIDARQRGLSTHYIFTATTEMADAELEIESDGASLMDYTAVPIPIPYADIPYVGGINCDIRLTLDVKVGGKMEFDAELGIGAEIWWAGTEFKGKALEGEKKFDITGCTFNGEITIGIVTGPRVSFLSVFSAGINIGCYLVIPMTTDVPKYKDKDEDSGNAVNEDTTVYKAWHACDKGKCLQGNAHIRIGVDIGISCGIITKTLVEYNYDWGPLLNFYHSYTFGTGEADLCPYYGYRLRVRVEDLEGNPISGATVNYEPYTTDYSPKEKFAEVASDVTDETGWATLYIPITITNFDTWRMDAKPYITTVSAHVITPDTMKSASAEYTQVGYGKLKNDKIDMNDWEKKELAEPTLVLTVDTRSFIFFEDPEVYAATNMPETIGYYPDKSKLVNLPDTIPEKPGCHFTGWNTKADGSGTSYTPGSVIEASHNITLYAQFELINNSYVVIYNANGGAGGPRAQIVSYGNGVQIPEETPTWSGSRFLGWSTNDASAAVEYEPGDLLVNEEKQSPIVLYAVWKYNPVTALRIQYDLNGGVAKTPPADQWIREGSLLTITEVIPEKIPKIFLGWSLEEDGQEAMFLPGKSYYFFDDAVLYAVFTEHPVTTPVEITFDANGGLADSVPDSVWIKPGTWFEVSETRPAWNERHYFLGWSEDPDAEAASWFPGRMASFREKTTLYAVWQTRYAISFDPSGGTLNGSSEVITWYYPAGTVVDIPGPPVWKGYTFLYWEGSVYYPGDQLTVGEDHLLRAVWQKEVPPTGDSSPILLWILLGAAGLGGLLLLRRRGRG